MPFIHHKRRIARRNLTPQPGPSGAYGRNDPGYRQLSYLSKRSPSPCIALKGIDELYDVFEKGNLDEKPFVKMLKNEKRPLVDILEFAFEKSLARNKGSRIKLRHPAARARVGGYIQIPDGKKRDEDKRSDRAVFDQYVNTFRKMCQQKEQPQSTSAAVLNPAQKTREACKDFYIAKKRQRDIFLRKLDALGSDRPLATQLKKLHLNKTAQDSSFRERPSAAQELRKSVSRSQPRNHPTPRRTRPTAQMQGRTSGIGEIVLSDDSTDDIPKDSEERSVALLGRLHEESYRERRVCDQ
jgi:hypothetical protein